ncbi:MAG: polysaccharide pyruvyl transferase family protein [Candidatus Kapabacteria bacterium]|jgi:hypothetical protein|nr:polysaccharide pyruvyl transferase family protein [Candidatus Kapabacteria bacterium]
MFSFLKNNKHVMPEGGYRTDRAIDRKSIIIHHYCPHTFNAGDHFVIRSIRQHLKLRIPEALFVPKSCADNRGWGAPTKLKGKNIDISNRYADAVVIGGSDQYNAWSLRIDKNEIEELAPPLYLIGLGASSKSLDGKPHIPNESFYEDIKATNAVAAMSSVRDNATSYFLDEVGVSKHIITGCPAMYLFNHKFEQKDSDYCLLTFPFPVIHSSNKELFDNLTELIKQLLNHIKSKGIRPIISCHDDRDVMRAQELFPEEELFFSNYVDDYYELYKNARAVFGTRLHATILSSGLGTPFININLDLRGKSFTETFGLENHNIDINDPRLNDKFISGIDNILSGNIKELIKFGEVKDSYRKVFDKFMDDTANDIYKKINKRIY